MSRFPSWYASIGSLLLVIGGCQALEDRIVFQPSDRTDPPTDPTTGGIPIGPAALGYQAYPVDLRTSDGTRIHAWWCPHPQAQAVILYCHGNNGDLNDRLEPGSKLLAELGQSVLVFDYPGFGQSAGLPSEAGCYTSAAAAYLWLRNLGYAPDQILVLGVSLGGGVAVELCRRYPAGALILVKTFTSIPDVAASLLAGLPIQGLVSNQFNNINKIDQCKLPIFIASGLEDRLIPYRQGVDLYEVAKAPKQFFAISGGDHEDPLTADFFQALRDFLATHSQIEVPPTLTSSAGTQDW